MNATAETYELAVCDDCLMMDANGELGRCMCETGEAPECEDAVHAAAMSAQGMDDFLFGGCADDCQGYFSMSRCDGCGSTLGGNRHDITAVRK